MILLLISTLASTFVIFYLWKMTKKLQESLNKCTVNLVGNKMVVNYRVKNKPSMMIIGTQKVNVRCDVKVSYTKDSHTSRLPTVVIKRGETTYVSDIIHSPLSFGVDSITYSFTDDVGNIESRTFYGSEKIDIIDFQFSDDPGEEACD